MSDVKQEVVTAVETTAKTLRGKVDSFIRANALKAIGISTFVGAIVGHFVL